MGDRLRIIKPTRRFKKGYMANWREELFTFGEVHPLIVDAGTTLYGTFYELQHVSVSMDKLYRVEAILQRHKVGKRWAEVL